MKKEQRQRDSVLDVGCGFADFYKWIEGQGRPVAFTGIDLSPDLLRVAREKHPHATLLCGELTDFKFELRVCVAMPNCMMII